MAAASTAAPMSAASPTCAHHFHAGSLLPLAIRCSTMGRRKVSGPKPAALRTREWSGASSWRGGRREGRASAAAAWGHHARMQHRHRLGLGSHPTKPMMSPKNGKVQATKVRNTTYADLQAAPERAGQGRAGPAPWEPGRAPPHSLRRRAVPSPRLLRAKQDSRSGRARLTFPPAAARGWERPPPARWRRRPSCCGATASRSRAGSAAAATAPGLQSTCTSTPGCPPRLAAPP